MSQRRLLKYGIFFASVSVATYYRQEIQDVSTGVLRFGRAAVAAGEIVYDYRRNLYSGKLAPGSEDYTKVASEVHLRAAKRLLKLCEDNGGAFIKVGQHLGALDYLIPLEYVRTLRVLHNHAPASKFEDIWSVIREDLQCEPSTVFKDIDESPIGTASLAQVHKAKLVDGTVVAVKVQHPLVKAYSDVDLKTMEILVDIASWVFPDFPLQWFVEESKRNLPRELDFVAEGQNSEKTAELMKHLPWLKIPKVYWEVTSPRVLTMEFCEGLHIGDMEKDRNTKFEPYKKEISSKITRLFSDMIFLHGYVHCDPHPGNVKVDLDEQGKLIIYLLDHGVYVQLPAEFRDNYASFWSSVINSDVPAMQANAKKLGVEEMYGIFACMVSGRSWNAILGGIDRHKKTTNEAEEIKEDASKYTREIIDVLRRVPREMLLIFKTNDLLKCLDSMLGIKNNLASFVTMSRSCADASYLKHCSQCHSLVAKWSLGLSYYLTHFRITLYQIFLWWVTWWNPSS